MTIISTVIQLLSSGLIVAGSFFCVVGAIGLLRLPDFFTRTHATTITDTTGAGMLLAGMALQAGFSLITIKLLLIFLLILFTSPTAAHALAQAALADSLKPWLATHKKEREGRS